MQSTTSSTRTFITPPTREEKNVETKQKVKKRHNLRSFLPWLLVIILVAAASFLFVQYRDARQKLDASAQNGSQQISDLVSKVRKLIVLPADQIPTVATVIHADKLRSQSFFAAAEDGDKVLVFNNQKEAILYRPSTNQIVTVSPVSVTSNDTSNLSK